jgi:hypothetical protein
MFIPQVTHIGLSDYIIRLSAAMQSALKGEFSFIH